MPLWLRIKSERLMINTYNKYSAESAVITYNFNSPLLLWLLKTSTKGQSDPRHWWLSSCADQSKVLCLCMCVRRKTLLISSPAAAVHRLLGTQASAEQSSLTRNTAALIGMAAPCLVMFTACRHHCAHVCLHQTCIFKHRGFISYQVQCRQRKGYE